MLEYNEATAVKFDRLIEDLVTLSNNWPELESDEVSTTLEGLDEMLQSIRKEFII